MRKSLALVMASAMSLASVSALAQPRPYADAWGGPSRSAPHDAGRYYYDGRWVDQNEWRRHEAERDRWARSYNQRHRRDDDNSSALVAGIIGFALGAAIVGSMDQAEHARTADDSWDAYCTRQYRSYDPRSRTYLGYDGLRHYCR